MNEQLSSNVSRTTAPGQSRLPVLLVVGAGVLFSLTVFFVMRWGAGKTIERAFQLAAKERSAAVEDAFSTEVGMMELARASLISDGKIEHDEFQVMLSPFIARSHSIYSVEWIPRVLDSQRAEFEAAARRRGLDAFRITEEGPKGKMVTARRRDEYFPIYFIGPKPRDPAIVGYDLASEPTRMESVRLARDTGKTVASGRITFVHDDDASGGFLVCLPVYEKDKPADTVADRRQNFMGCILGVFRPMDMIRSAVAALQPEGIDVALYDPSISAGGQVFDVHASRAGPDAENPADSRRFLDPAGHHYT